MGEVATNDNKERHHHTVADTQPGGDQTESDQSTHEWDQLYVEIQWWKIKVNFERKEFRTREEQKVEIKKKS